MASIAETINNVLQTGRKVITIYNQTSQFVEVRFRTCLVQPSMPNALPTTLWCSTTARRMFLKLSNSWVECKTVESMFSNDGSDSEGSGHTGSGIQAVQSLLELAALDTSGLQDKQIVYVENELCLYAYDAQGFGVAGPLQCAPNSGVGMWTGLTSQVNVGNLDGGIY